MFIPKLEDAVWGFIVGDALGVPYEFTERESLKLHPATGMTGYGTYDQPPGTWSDDTSMMLCVLENIKKRGNQTALAKLFIQWYQSGYHTPHGEVFDIGLITRSALDRIIAKQPRSTWDTSKNSDYGNGALMRSVPYAFIPDYARGIYQMLLENRITHHSTLSQKCCIFYTRMLRLLAEGENKETARDYAGKYVRKGLRLCDHDEAEIEEMRLLNRLFDPNFSNCSVDDIKSGGYVLHTLEASVWCFLTTTSYSEAVLRAVNLGGDTDTIAALTGALSAVHYGMEQIPAEWIQQLANRSDILAVLDMEVVESIENDPYQASK